MNFENALTLPKTLSFINVERATIIIQKIVADADSKLFLAINLFCKVFMKHFLAN